MSETSFINLRLKEMLKTINTIYLIASETRPSRINYIFP